MSTVSEQSAQFLALDISQRLENMIDNTFEFWEKNGYKTTQPSLLNEEDVYHSGRPEEELDKILGEQKSHADNMAKKIEASMKIAYWGTPKESRGIFLKEAESLVHLVISKKIVDDIMYKGVKADNHRARGYMANKIIGTMANLVSSYERMNEGK